MWMHTSNSTVTNLRDVFTCNEYCNPKKHVTDDETMRMPML